MLNLSLNLFFILDSRLRMVARPASKKAKKAKKAKKMSSPSSMKQKLPKKQLPPGLRPTPTPAHLEPSSAPQIAVDSHEAIFARKLASNEPKIRERALKALKKWLRARSESGLLTEEELLLLWKGLYFCYWMSDKPLIQV